jgi:uncharacterized protein
MNREQIEQLARTRMLKRQEHDGREPGWLFYHGLRTARVAWQICDRLNLEIDRDVVYTGALFHDIGKGSEPHNLKGAKIVAKILEKHCDGDRLQQICEIVRLHNQRQVSGDHAPAVRVVQDADVLDHVGPVAPWLAFYWSGTRNETVDDHVRFITGRDHVRYLQKMRNMLNFDVSLAMFDERVRWQESFLETFRKAYYEGEWHAGGEQEPADLSPRDAA